MALLYLGLLIFFVLAGLLVWSGAAFSPRASAAWMPQRLIIYALALVALVASLYAVAALLSLGVALVTGQIGTAISPGEARNRASLALATLIVNLPLWLVCWSAARRRLARSLVEQDARERRLWFAAVFALTATVALFSLQAVLQALYTLPAPARERPPIIHTIDAAARLAVFGPAWLAFARLGWRERKPHAADALHDLALFMFACYALGFLWHGLIDALSQMVAGLVGRQYVGVWSGPARSAWAIWGEIASWILSGGSLWLAFLRYDLARRGQRLVRALYLYAVWLVAGINAVAAATYLLYELSRRTLGYRPGDGTWLFLADVVPWLLPAGLICAVHWHIVGLQAGIDGAPPAVPDEIAWPRRPGLAIQSFAGLSMLVVGLVTLLWLVIDALCGTRTGGAWSWWWRDRLCAGLAMTIVGLVLWLAAWQLLRRAAAAAPTQERPARARRILLSSIVIVSALVAFGFAIDVIWLLIRALLGEGMDIAARARVLQYTCTVMVTGTVAAVHGLLLRDDQRWQPRQTSRMRLSVLIEDGAVDMLPALAALPNVKIEVVNHVSAARLMPGQDFHALAGHLAALSDRDRLAGAVLILGPTSCVLYPYSEDARAAAEESTPHAD